MKRGEFAVPKAPPGTQPDLTGLSCGFEEIPSARGLILSVLVVSARDADPSAFRRVIEDIIALVERIGRQPAGAAGWPAAEMAAERKRIHGPCYARRVAFQTTRLRARQHAVRLFGVAFRHQRRRLRAENPFAAGGGEFRLPQIRRRIAHDPRLHARARKRANAAAVRSGLGGKSRDTGCTVRTRR